MSEAHAFTNVKTKIRSSVTGEEHLEHNPVLTECIDGIEYVLRKASDMIDNGLTAKYELLALRLKDCNKAKFNLFE